MMKQIRIDEKQEDCSISDFQEVAFQKILNFSVLTEDFKKLASGIIRLRNKQTPKTEEYIR